MGGQGQRNVGQGQLGFLGVGMVAILNQAKLIGASLLLMSAFHTDLLSSD